MRLSMARRSSGERSVIPIALGAVRARTSAMLVLKTAAEPLQA